MHTPFIFHSAIKRLHTYLLALMLTISSLFLFSPDVVHAQNANPFSTKNIPNSTTAHHDSYCNNFRIQLTELKNKYINTTHDYHFRMATWEEVLAVENQFNRDFMFFIASCSKD